jgi:hypothetical protein
MPPQLHRQDRKRRMLRWPTLPFLVGKLLVGAGGWLLAAFCPEQGPRHPGTMWLIFAPAASVAPIVLILFRRYIRVPEAGRQN